MIIKGGQIKYKKCGKEVTFTFNNDKRYGNEDIGIAINMHKSDNEERYTAFITLHTEIEIEEFYLKGVYSYGDRDKVLSNGFQTWTESRECSKNDRIKKLNFLAKPFLSIPVIIHFIIIHRKKGLYTVIHTQA